MENVVNIKSLISGVVLFSTVCASTAFAGDAENIEACVSKAKEFASVTLDEFDVAYEGNWMAFSVAKWDNAECEVKLENVYNLTIEGKIYIYQGFDGKESYTLNDMLEKKTKAAIKKMRSRISLLEQRMEKVTTQLKSVNPDHQALDDYINKGVNKSL